MPIKLFRRCLVRIGHSTYHVSDGAMHDLGNIGGDDLIALSIKMRVPLLHVVPNRRTLPYVQMLREPRAFQFDQHEPVLSTWRTNPVS